MSAMGIWTKPLARRTLPRARMRVHWRFQPRKRLRENRSYVRMRPSLGEAFMGTSMYYWFFAKPASDKGFKAKID